MTQNEEENLHWSVEKLRRKADQEWEMAGLARQDGDTANAAKHTRLAKMYEERANKILMAS